MYFINDMSPCSVHNDSFENIWTSFLEYNENIFTWLQVMSALHPDSTHYSAVILSTIASLITSLTIVYSTVYSDADQRRHQSPVSLAFVWGIHRRPVDSPHKWPVTRKMFPFDDVIMPLYLPVMPTALVGHTDQLIYQLSNTSLV